MADHRIAPDKVIPTLERRILVDGFHVVLDLDRSTGSRVYDARDGKEYLDCYSFFASSPLGLQPSRHDGAGVP